MRQSAQPQLLIRTLAAGYTSGTVLEAHTHRFAQLVYAIEGVMSVETEQGTFVVPSQRAVWIPHATPHTIAMSGWVSLRTLYLSPALRGLPRRCCVVAVPPLLRELILHVIESGPLRSESAVHRRLAGFLVDQVRNLRAAPLELPVPRDLRALRVARRLRDEPGSTEPVERLARAAGTSRRTLERLFRSETGMTLGRWRQQARLLHALRLLPRGEPVTRIAQDVGYESPSAFIAIFKRVFGMTPGSYYKAQRQPG